ncbi:MAG TPA: hypothetical protein VG273_23505 [Bryobacteraceae bacterium]|jgi:hypothetical protein|nr:hypothetical protein [Bryobacteraceae bacterium]
MAMFFQVEFSHRDISGEFKPVMRRSFTDLQRARDAACSGVMDFHIEGIHATVTGEDGVVLHQCWMDREGRLRWMDRDGHLRDNNWRDNNWRGAEI